MGGAKAAVNGANRNAAYKLCGKILRVDFDSGSGMGI